MTHKITGYETTYPNLDTLLYLWDNRRELSILEQIRIGKIMFYFDKMKEEGEDDKATLQELEQKAITYFKSKNITPHNA